MDTFYAIYLKAYNTKKKIKNLTKTRNIRKVRMKTKKNEKK